MARQTKLPHQAVFHTELLTVRVLLCGHRVYRNCGGSTACCCYVVTLGGCAGNGTTGYDGETAWKRPIWKPCKVIKGKYEAGASGNRLLRGKVDETGLGSCPGGVAPIGSASREHLVTATDGSSQILHGNIAQRELGFQFIASSLCQSTDIGRKALQRDTVGCHCGNHEDTTPYRPVQVCSRSETSAHLYQTTRRHIPDGRYLHR